MSVCKSWSVLHARHELLEDGLPRVLFAAPSSLQPRRLGSALCAGTTQTALHPSCIDDAQQIPDHVSWRLPVAEAFPHVQVTKAPQADTNSQYRHRTRHDSAA